MKHLGEHHIPEYILCYLVNGDSSGVSDADVQRCEEWIAEEFSGYSGLIFDLDETSPVTTFNTSPAFGLPCTTVYCSVFGKGSRVPVYDKLVPFGSIPAGAKFIAHGVVFIKQPPAQLLLVGGTAANASPEHIGFDSTYFDNETHCQEVPNVTE